MHRSFRLSLIAAVALLAGCGSKSSGTSPADASTDAAGDGAPSSDAGTEELPAPPPSDDCRYIEDGMTCVNSYGLNDSDLYECGHLTASDQDDGGGTLPYPPPLPYTYDCRSVSPPMADPANPSLLMGVSWCCLHSPQKCVRAIALDSTCPSAMGKAWSCPSAGLDFPPGSDDGGTCSTPSEIDAGLTPPQNANETFYCCP